jgi:hypothetical protein
MRREVSGLVSDYGLAPKIWGNELLKKQAWLTKLCSTTHLSEIEFKRQYMNEEPLPMEFMGIDLNKFNGGTIDMASGPMKVEFDNRPQRMDYLLRLTSIHWNLRESFPLDYHLFYRTARHPKDYLVDFIKDCAELLDKKIQRYLDDANAVGFPTQIDTTKTISRQMEAERLREIMQMTEANISQIPHPKAIEKKKKAGRTKVKKPRTFTNHVKNGVGSIVERLQKDTNEWLSPARGLLAT